MLTDEGGRVKRQGNGEGTAGIVITVTRVRGVVRCIRLPIDWEWFRNVYGILFEGHQPGEEVLSGGTGVGVGRIPSPRLSHEAGRRASGLLRISAPYGRRMRR